MKLIIEGFSQGLVDENTITRMGLANIKPGISSQEVRLSDCPATDINAMDFYTRGALNKMQGRENLNSTAWKDSAITRIYQWQSASTNEFTLVFSCTSGAASAAIATVTVSGGSATFASVSASGSALSNWAPSIDNMIDITAYAGSAVMAYGGNLPLAVYTGGDYIAPILGTGNPSGAKTVAAWGSYLFAGNVLVGGIRYRYRVVWNDALNQDTWPAANYMDLDSEEGDVITAMWLLKNVIVVFKKYKTYVIKYVGGTQIFDWEKIDNSVGCVGPNAICEKDGVLYFIGADGFYAFDGTSPPYRISDKIERLVERMNSSKIHVFEADNFDTKGQIFFNIAEGSSERKNKIYIYDPTVKNWTQWSVSAASLSSILYGANLMYIDFPNAYETYSLIVGEAGGAGDTFLAFGSYDGKLQRFGESENDLGATINSYWVSPWIDIGYPDRNKRILRTSAFIDSSGATEYTITLTVYTDWNDVTAAKTITFTSTAADKDIAEKRLDFTLPGRAFKFKLSINQLNALITIHKIVLDFLIKGRTLVS
jgi:hypothetical protein